MERHDSKKSQKCAFIDCNTKISICIAVWYEPTDSEKACKPFLSNAWKSLSYSSPNLAELCTMNKTLGVKTPEGKLCYSSFISKSHQKTNSHPLLLMLELLSKMQILWRKLRMWFCIAAVLPSTLDETLSVAVALSRPLLEHLHCLVVTLGANGVLLCGEYDEGTVNLQPRKQKRVRMVFMPACNDLLWQ